MVLVWLLLGAFSSSIVSLTTDKPLQVLRLDNETHCDQKMDCNESGHLNVKEIADHDLSDPDRQSDFIALKSGVHNWTAPDGTVVHIKHEEEPSAQLVESRAKGAAHATAFAKVVQKKCSSCCCGKTSVQFSGGSFNNNADLAWTAQGCASRAAGLCYECHSVWNVGIWDRSWKEYCWPCGTSDRKLWAKYSNTQKLLGNWENIMTGDGSKVW